jgi:hypothetical protein
VLLDHFHLWQWTRQGLGLAGIALPPETPKAEVNKSSLAKQTDRPNNAVGVEGHSCGIQRIMKPEMAAR